jgi:tetratricopeptide (TPR) repeat protein
VAEPAAEAGKVARVSPRARVSAVVAEAASTTAGATALATALTSTEPPTGAAPAPRPRAGAPPLVLDLGVRTDREARALRRAAALYGRKRRAAAQRIFDRYDSVEARVGAALARWPHGFGTLTDIARRDPRSGAAWLNLGLGEYWLGRTTDARRAWRRAKVIAPDSEYAVRAGDLLHPEDPVPGLPMYVPGFRSPPELDRLRAPAQLAFLERSARGGDAHAKILYGVALQRLGRPVSAERQFREAAALAPGDPGALTAEAVGLFDKDRPSAAFSRLGPLARQFPRAATVRFHLGLLLLWLGQVDPAKRQLRLARAAQPGSVFARQAAAFLRRLP